MSSALFHNEMLFVRKHIHEQKYIYRYRSRPCRTHHRPSCLIWITHCGRVGPIDLCFDWYGRRYTAIIIVFSRFSHPWQSNLRGWASKAAATAQCDVGIRSSSWSWCRQLRHIYECIYITTVLYVRHREIIRQGAYATYELRDLHPQLIVGWHSTQWSWLTTSVRCWYPNGYLHDKKKSSEMIMRNWTFGAVTGWSFAKPLTRLILVVWV